MQKNVDFYDDFFRKYPVEIHDNKPRFETVAKLLNGRVLDVACGTGTLSKYYNGLYYGIDISQVAINKANENRRKDANFSTGDFTQPQSPFKNLFDCVYIGEFLEHIENDDQVFKNVLLMIKPNGKIVISVPNGDRIPDESHCRIFTVPKIKEIYSKYGKISFHNYEDFDRRIIFSIELGQANENNLTLVMIVKDEEKGLEKAITSALPLVDNVVISVDYASSDKTEKIAEMYADTLKFHKWQNDFSKARNFAQLGVTSKWILFIDGHEYIEDFGKIKEKMNLDVDGIFVTIRMESGMTFLFPRIYQRGIQFKNAVHNINPCETKTACPDFIIVHDREHLQTEKSTEAREKQRIEMMPVELKKHIKQDKRNSRAHFHLANFYMMRQNIKGAMHHYKKTIKYTKNLDEKYICYLHLGYLHQLKKHNFRSLWCFIDAKNLQPERWEAKRVLGGWYFLQKNYKVALDYFVEALEPNKRHYIYEPMAFSSSDVWDMMANCFVKLNQNAEAVMAWERAKEDEKDENKIKLYNEKIRLVKTLLV